MNAVVTKKRCAVYTRVSTDERLDQSFNSLDAQREAGQAYIVSQRAEGWMPVGDDYDDGGYSGGNMERPALKRLMAEHGEAVIAAIAIAARRPVDWVAGLDLDEAVRLAEAVFGVNADFFIRRLLPSVTQAAARIGQTLESPTRGAMPFNG